MQAKIDCQVLKNIKEKKEISKDYSPTERQNSMSKSKRDDSSKPVKKPSISTYLRVNGNDQGISYIQKNISAQVLDNSHLTTGVRTTVSSRRPSKVSTPN